MAPKWPPHDPRQQRSCKTKLALEKVKSCHQTADTIGVPKVNPFGKRLYSHVAAQTFPAVAMLNSMKIRSILQEQGTHVKSGASRATLARKYKSMLSFKDGRQSPLENGLESNATCGNMDVDLLDQPSENVVGLLDSEDDVHSTASSVKVATLRQPLSTTGSDSRASHWIDLTNNSIHDRTLPDPEDAMDEDQQSNVSVEDCYTDGNSMSADPTAQHFPTSSRPNLLFTFSIREGNYQEDNDNGNDDGDDEDDEDDDDKHEDDCDGDNDNDDDDDDDDEHEDDDKGDDHSNDDEDYHYVNNSHLQHEDRPGTRDLMNVDQQSDMPSEDEDNHQPSTTLRRSPRNRIVNFSDCNNDEDLRNAETNQEECSDDSRNNESEESDYSNEREWVPIAAEDPDSSYTNGPAPQRDVTTRNPAKDSDTNTNKPDLTTLSTAHLRRLVKSHGLPYSRITRDNLLILCESFSQQQQPSGTRSGQTFCHQVSDTPSSPPADFDSHPDGEAGPDGQQSEKHNNISCQAMHRRTAAEIKDMKKTQKLTLAQLNKTLRVVQQLRDDLKKKSTRGAKARGKLEGSSVQRSDFRKLIRRHVAVLLGWSIKNKTFPRPATEGEKSEWGAPIRSLSTQGPPIYIHEAATCQTRCSQELVFF
ncbi:hypothetical protein KEM48_007711 [Puccinia striiformis f. sp. tritici PST-130]|nr:hypothetical protein KEM48_007711 [Puccinia striiformis f. sp. tritici PST-130]